MVVLVIPQPVIIPDRFLGCLIERVRSQPPVAGQFHGTRYLGVPIRGSPSVASGRWPEGLMLRSGRKPVFTQDPRDGGPITNGWFLTSLRDPVCPRDHTDKCF